MTEPKNGPDIAEFRTSPLLERAGFRHAFFTRRGGVSAGEFSSLNFSVGVGDSPERVQENLERAARVLGVERRRLYFLSQVHGRVACSVRGDEAATDVVHTEGDALAARSPSAAVCVRIADCVPILVGDAESGAAVAIHAGWKGLVAGIVEAGISELRRLAGGSGKLIAAIGPHIGPTAFEVGEDVAGTISAAAGDPAVVHRPEGRKPRVALARVARAALGRLGLDDGSIDVVPGCTFTEPELFFSYRRDGARSGRHLAAIVPRAGAG